MTTMWHLTAVGAGRSAVAVHVASRWWISLLAVLIFVASPVFGDTAEAWYTNGIENIHRGDLNAAFSEFNKAIQLNPNFAAAYYPTSVTTGPIDFNIP
jgi:hypothetical protein